MKYFRALINLSFLLFPYAFSAQVAQPTPPPAQIQIKEIEKTTPRTEPRPNIKAYLDYLKQELTVTDERISQREVNPAYIRHNYNRVSALRMFALKLANETVNDYIPEMEAIAAKEFHILFFDNPPPIAELKIGEIYNFSYRFLGSVKNAQTFYIFARLDPYEEDEVRRKIAQSAKPPVQNSDLKEKHAKEKTEKTSLEKSETLVVSEGKSEKPLTPAIFLSGEDKKKDVFVKKNP